MAETNQVLALINFVLGIGISVMAFCRLASATPGSPITRVAPYALMLAGGLASACQPWMGYWPTPNNVFYSVAVFLYVYSTRSSHRGGL